MKDIFKFSEQPEFENPSLIVGWNKDAGRLSPRVIEYLNEKIKSKSFCEIEPAGFSSLAGVQIENDIAQFPESKFYYSDREDLLIFKGSEPRFEQRKFLDAILDVAEGYCKIKELYTISGTISAISHTGLREISAVFNQSAFKKELSGFGLKYMTWQGPPAISSHLLWTAQKRGIPGVSLWPEIPFYLAAGKDFQAVKLTLSFLDKKLNLGLDFTELDEEIRNQNIKIDRLRQEDVEINKCMGMLESKLSLSEEEQIELTRKVTELLERRD